MGYVEVGVWSGHVYPPGSVVVGFNGRDHSRAALMWAGEEARRRAAPLLGLFAANYPGMTLDPGPGLLHRDPAALEAAEEITAQGVSEVVAAYPDLSIFGATEVTSPTHALTDASQHAALLVVGSRGYDACSEDFSARCHSTLPHEPPAHSSSYATSNRTGPRARGGES